MTYREPPARVFWPLWAFAACLLAVACLTSCASAFLSGSSKLQKTMADAESEIAATDCLYLYSCVWGRGAVDLGPGQSCDGLLPTAVPTPGFVAPPPCDALYRARRDAKGHLAEAAGVVANGSDATDLRKKLERDIKAMRDAD